MLIGDGGGQIRVGAAPTGVAPPRAAPAEKSTYAADWAPSPGASPTPGPGAWSTPAHASARPTSSPSPGPAPQAPRAPDIAAQRRELQTAKTDAALAEDVYHDPPKPPAGYHVADGAELTRLGLTPKMLDDGRSDFRARVYVGDDGRTVVAYRGSLSREDWKNDIEQGAGLHSEYYDRAIEIGQHVARSGATVTFTGHSLGGGLASASAVASGQGADTFNAAGITSGTIAKALDANRTGGAGGRAGHVDAYYDGGDPLSKFQDANALEGDVLGTVGGWILGGPLGGIFGGGLGAAAGHAPSAYGARHELATIDPPGGGSITDRHGMGYIDRGLDRALGQLH